MLPVGDHSGCRELRRLAGREGLGGGRDLDGADVSVATASPEQEAKAGK
jgi:hypothetical protein